MGRADRYEHGTNNVICDRCGFKFKANQVKKEWNGLYTCLIHCWEQRHPQDLIRSKHDNQRPDVSRPGGSDQFITEIPIANAGVHQYVLAGETAQLDGSLSYDKHGLPLTYLWTQTDGEPVTLSDNTAAAPTFFAPSIFDDTSHFMFSLVVNNGVSNSAPSVTHVIVEPIPGAWDVCNMVKVSQYSPPTGVEENYSLFFEATGTYLFWGGRDTQSGGFSFVRRITLAVPWELLSIIDATIQKYPVTGFTSGVLLSSDGLIMLTLGQTDSIEQHALSVPWDLNTATLVNSVPLGLPGLFPSSVSASSDGNNLHVSTLDVGNSFIQGYTLNNFDINTLVQTPGDRLPLDIWPSNPFDQRIYQHYMRYDNGSRIFAVDPNKSGVYQADLASPFDLTSAVSKGVGSTLQTNTGVTWRPNGKTVYIAQTGGLLEQYDIVDGTLGVVPTADAGPPQSVVAGNVVQLDGSLSISGNALSVTYLWAQTSGTAVTLDDNTLVNPTFTAPVVTANEDLIFSLVVNNGCRDSASDSVVITVS